ncbi:hypothetical protein U1Q18_030550 [Sarracenia purpurea var. burkii]
MEDAFWVQREGLSGALGLLWKKLDVRIRSFSKGHIDCIISDQCSGGVWRVTDHLPLVVCSEEEGRYRRRGARQRVYRFEHMWIQSEECKDIIKEGWGEASDSGLRGIRLKLERVGNKLSSWGWAKFGHIKGRIRKLREDLARIQASGWTGCSQEEEDHMAKELE